jgi:hypothetical protein
MDQWCEENADNPRVLDWLRVNGPPSFFTGTAMQWAYLEMPLWFKAFVRRVG